MSDRHPCHRTGRRSQDARLIAMTTAEPASPTVQQIVLVSPGSDFTYVITPSTSELGRWQLTCFDGRKPIGHTTFDTPADAEAAGCGRFVGIEPPVGDRTYERAYICASCGELAPASATVCPDCGGDPAADMVKCDECDGEGTVVVAGSRPWDEKTIECSTCEGRREVPSLWWEERQETMRAAGEGSGR